jgi:thioredoxin reductase (NADPH)
MEQRTVCILGAGVAGLTAALYCARANLNPIIFTGDFEYQGGLLMKTSIVENYPGFSNGISGFELMQNMKQQVLNYPCTFIDDIVLNINKQDNNIFIVVDSNSNVYYVCAVIIATGSSPNKLKLQDEELYWSLGISSCAVCDGALYKRKKIMVVGGGDSAMEEALFLTKFSQVTLVHRRDEFRASKVLQQRVLNNPNITIKWNTEIVKLVGNGTKLIAVILRDNQTTEETQMCVDGLFYGLGLTPNSNTFKCKGLLFDNDGYILRNVQDEYETSTHVPGVFVAGDVADKIYRQAIVAAGDGCKAALDVEKYLQAVENLH